MIHNDDQAEQLHALTVPVGGYELFYVTPPDGVSLADLMAEAERLGYERTPAGWHPEAIAAARESILDKIERRGSMQWRPVGDRHWRDGAPPNRGEMYEIREASGCGTCSMRGRVLNRHTQMYDVCPACKGRCVR